MATILVLDDDLDISTIISQLAEDANHHAYTASTIAEGLTLLTSTPIDLVFLDVRLPDGNGLEALPEIRKSPSSPIVIIITGLGDPDGAELAIQNGAWDYIEKTSTPRHILFSMERALRYREKDRLPAFSNLKRKELIGESRALRQVLENIAVASSGDAGVLISGETGTGKEVVARTIHDNSLRAANKFVVLDCASLSASLAEGELFGHIKGAFTGADSSRIGLVGQADGGTLFLDEVGELPQAVQATFLRVLQEKRFRPVGSAREFSSDFRLIAATNRNLEEMCAAALFRNDLYYRIKACAIQLPPLRHRVEDIPALCGFHLERLCRKYGKESRKPSDDFLNVLANYDWPGNVRELVQTLERTLMRAGDELVLYPEHLPVDIRAKAMRTVVSRGKPPRVNGLASQAETSDLADGLSPDAIPEFKAFRRQYLDHAEKLYLRHLLRLANGDIKAACDLSGLSRTRLYALLKDHGMSTK
ncbi:sigma 54-interacting transcriptional regulator [Desulfovibrio aminophilus]|uniref:sigma-54-dependent transcriptional regulator n=1 Tax=Desulfovibrio aminophilus TaxID=81425 RepID=UPI00339B7041